MEEGDMEGGDIEGGDMEGGDIMEGGKKEGEDVGDENRDIVEDDWEKSCRSIKEKREQVLSFRVQMVT